MGWFMMALVDELKYVPAAHPRRGELPTALSNLVAGIKNFQDPSSKLWFQVVNKTSVTLANNYIETSGSGMFIYALKTAVDMADQFGDLSPGGAVGLDRHPDEDCDLFRWYAPDSGICAGDECAECGSLVCAGLAAAGKCARSERHAASAWLRSHPDGGIRHGISIDYPAGRVYQFFCRIWRPPINSNGRWG